MNKDVAKELVVLANHLDSIGLTNEADEIDFMVKEAFGIGLGLLICTLTGCKKSGTDIAWDYEYDVLNENIVDIIPYGDVRVKYVPDHPPIDQKRDPAEHHYPQQGQQIVITWKCSEEPKTPGVEDGPGLKDNEYEGDLVDITYVWCADMPAKDKLGEPIAGAFTYSQKPRQSISAPSSCGGWDEVDKPEIDPCYSSAANDGHLEHQESS